MHFQLSVPIWKFVVRSLVETSLEPHVVVVFLDCVGEELPDEVVFSAESRTNLSGCSARLTLECVVSTCALSSLACGRSICIIFRWTEMTESPAFTVHVPNQKLLNVP